jgi:hypothetical protein
MKHVFVIVFLLGIILVGCKVQSNTDPVVGNWELKTITLLDGTVLIASENDIAITYKVANDNNFVMTDNTSGSVQEYSGTWTVDGNNYTFIVLQGSAPMTFVYNLSTNKNQMSGSGTTSTSIQVFQRK